MTPMNIQNFECQNCGAPLAKTDKPGEFHCDYCGALYADENQGDISPIEPSITPDAAPDSETEVSEGSEATDELTPEERKAVNQLFTIVGVGLTIVCVCLLIFFIIPI